MSRWLSNDKDDLYARPSPDGNEPKVMPLWLGLMMV